MPKRYQFEFETRMVNLKFSFLGYWRCAQLFVDNGARRGTKNAAGNTPLDLLLANLAAAEARVRRPSSARTAASAAATLQRRRRLQHGRLHLAVRHGDPEALRVLALLWPATR